MAAFDVFPPSNGPTDSEPWFREVKKRIIDLENAAIGIDQDTGANNRTTASNLQSLSDQLDALERAYNSSPITSQTTASASSFGLGAGWNDVVKLTVVPPPGTIRTDVMVVSSGLVIATTSTNLVQTSSRISGAGLISQEIQNPWYVGNGNFPNIITTSFGLTNSGGGQFDIALQVNPVDAAPFTPNSENYAVLTAFSTFTRAA